MILWNSGTEFIFWWKLHSFGMRKDTADYTVVTSYREALFYVNYKLSYYVFRRSIMAGYNLRVKKYITRGPPS